MEYRVGAAEGLEQGDAVGQVVSETVQVGEQASTQLALLGRGLDLRRGERLEHADRVADIGDEE